MCPNAFCINCMLPLKSPYPGCVVPLVMFLLFHFSSLSRSREANSDHLKMGTIGLTGRGSRDAYTSKNKKRIMWHNATASDSPGWSRWLKVNVVDYKLQFSCNRAGRACSHSHLVSIQPFASPLQRPCPNMKRKPEPVHWTFKFSSCFIPLPLLSIPMFGSLWQSNI